MATVSEKQTNRERGEEAERAANEIIRPRLGYVPPVKCPQHGATMTARNSYPRFTYYRCKHCTYSKKVSRPD